jgi:hypothetical protein
MAAGNAPQQPMPRRAPGKTYFFDLTRAFKRFRTRSK